MKVPLSWIKEFVTLHATPEQISETLTLLGIEVEKISGLTVSFTNVVVGKVLSVEKHPNADRLKVTRVTDGTTEYQVVCGAPNCREGLIVAFARIGGELTDDEGKKWKIKKSKIRDVESEGMLCSGKELHLSSEHEGILELSSDLPLGANFANFVTDPIFDISLTPNLGYCLSILGVARELGAAYQTKVKTPTVQFKETGSKKIVVEINDSKLCPRYACRIMTGVKVGPSPKWLQDRLIAVNLRPINNLVDIANYVMLEVGQPLHIFDLDAIDEKIVVAPSMAPQKLETLDGQLREIPPQTLFISDSKKPLAVAGIMGLQSSAASDKTCNILIESAVFDPTSIRRAGRLLDLKTDASYRFERGVDGARVTRALDRAAALLQALAGGEIHPLVDVKSHDFSPRTINCRLSRIHKMLGFSLSLSEVVSLFERLEMDVKTSDDVLEITVPTYRNDLHEEIDLIEEIARLYGYNNIPRGKPTYTDSSLLDTPLYTLEKNVQTLLLEQGLQECITCDLISPALAALTMEKGIPENSTIHVLHPRSMDQSVLRTSLLPGLLQVVKHNFNHQVEDISAFEIGRIHFRLSDTIEEASCAGIILTGAKDPHHFDQKPKTIDFFDMKGVVENLCNRLRIARYSFEPSHLHTLHPWRQAKVKSGDVTLGVFGEIHPELLAKFSINHRVYFAELHLPDILQLKKKAMSFSQLPQFPASARDWTITLKADTPMASVFQAIQRVKCPVLEDVYLLDLFAGEQIGIDKKNATFRFTYRDLTKTISFETVDQEHQKLIHSVMSQFL
ncbi:MAG TPA: phenylalanine--tRNA ligase subunit beta [Rhabdochlamydiaceae bacterium]|nr:phenylalanine--tRNA ligase subunit beta [Rhabdochlamydiaceae bacterium]